MERTVQTRALAAALVAALAILGMGATAPGAQTVTWTGATSTWADGDGTNWTGGDGVYSDGDDTVFPGSGVGSSTVSVSGTVVPGSMQFDTSAFNYTLQSGALSGSGPLTLTGAEWLEVVSIGRTNPIDLTDYSGNVNINGGTLRLRYSGSDLTVGLGSGNVNIDGGTLHLAHSGVWNTPVNFTNAVTIGGGGGTVNVASVSNRQVLQLSGQWTLNGDLTWTGPAYSYDGQVRGPNMDLPFNIGAHVTITSNIENHLAGQQQQFMRSGLHAGGLYDVTYAGNSMPLPADPADLRVRNLYVQDAASLSTGETTDYLAGTTNMTGKVIVQSGGALTLGTGIHTLDGKVEVQAGGQLRLNPGGWQALTIDDNELIVGTDGMVPTLPLLRSQSGLRIGNASGTLIIDDGGTFRIHGSDQKHFFGGHMRLLGGSTLDITHGGAGPSRTLGFQLYDQYANKFDLSRTTGNLYLGDGDPDTKETVTIRGRHNTANADGTFAISVQNAKFIDDGGVTLRYESVGADADEWFNFGWTTATGQGMYETRMTVNSQFRGGSEGTEFAPATVGHGIAAVGPESGTVFTISSAATLVTEGTVGFYNSQNITDFQGQRSTLGPIAVNADGSFMLEAAGTVQADSITVQSGSSIGGIGTFDVVSGILLGGDVAPGSSIGELTIDGDLTMLDGSSLIIETAGGDQSDVLHVNGILDITDGELVLEALGSWYEGTFSIATYDTLLGDEFATITNNTGRRLYEIDYLTGNSITIMLVPEPGSALLLAMAALALTRRRLRKANA